MRVMSISSVEVVPGEFRRCRHSFGPQGSGTARTTSWEGKLRGKGGEVGVVEARGRGGLMSHLQELLSYSVST